MIPATTSRILPLIAALLLVASAPSSAQPGRPFSFIAIGDAGQPGSTHSSTAAAVNATATTMTASGSAPGMMIFLGDNFYPSGLNTSDAQWVALRDAILEPYRDLMRRVGRENVRAITGNHDYYCRSVNAIPYGFCVTGNEREQAIPEWTYDYYRPVSVRRALVEGGADSVEFILFDSSFLLTRPTLFWTRPLDMLEELLRASAAAPGVRWRIFAAHHSTRTIGEHAGWRRWMPTVRKVGYIGNCRGEGQDPFRYVYEFFSTQDNCSERYRRYIDSLNTRIDRAGAKIQVLLAGHEHSLQLMHYPDYGCEECPKVFVISGAGSKTDRVKSPAPPREFSHPRNDPEFMGRSAPGFIAARFEKGRLRVDFVDGRDGSKLDMGGRSSFLIDEAGSLLDAQ
jgi:hypothetical protein